MVGILFLVGHGLESPDVITHMLDIEKCPRKPQYGMASGQVAMENSNRIEVTRTEFLFSFTLYYRASTGLV